MSQFHSQRDGARRGVTAVEYGLFAALIAAATVASLTSVGINLTATFNDIAAKVLSANSDTGPR